MDFKVGDRVKWMYGEYPKYVGVVRRVHKVTLKVEWDFAPGRVYSNPTSCFELIERKAPTYKGFFL